MLSLNYFLQEQGVIVYSLILMSFLRKLICGFFDSILRKKDEDPSHCCSRKFLGISYFEIISFPAL